GSYNLPMIAEVSLVIFQQNGPYVARRPVHQSERFAGWSTLCRHCALQSVSAAWTHSLDLRRLSTLSASDNKSVRSNPASAYEFQPPVAKCPRTSSRSRGNDPSHVTPR